MIFAVAVGEVIVVSSDDEAVVEVADPTIEVADPVIEVADPVIEVANPVIDVPNPVLGNEWVLVDDNVGDEWVEPEVQWDPLQMVDEEMVLVPNESHVHAVPLQMIPPLDTVQIFSQSTQSSTFWWEYLNFASDDDASTANSFNYTTQGIRGRSRYKNHHSPLKPNVSLSSTASNSPCGKPPKKFK